MSGSNKSLWLIAAAAAAIAGLGAASYAGYSDGPAGSTVPVPCEVVVSPAGSSKALEAIYNAQGPVSGEYSFAVKTSGSHGSSNISQGGGFSASSAGPISLGRVMVGPASRYDIALTVKAAGKSHTCLVPDIGSV